MLTCAHQEAGSLQTRQSFQEFTSVVGIWGPGDQTETESLLSQGELVMKRLLTAVRVVIIATGLTVGMVYASEAQPTPQPPPTTGNVLAPPSNDPTEPTSSSDGSGSSEEVTPPEEMSFEDFFQLFLLCIW
jgi:hypothetical protein